MVRTLKSTRRELEALGHTVDMITPLEFRTVPCPTYPEIRLSLLPSARVRRRIEAFAPDALHIATEGPLGLAARSHALRRRLPFTTAYHTRFPEYVQARFGVPLAWTYRFLRWFHGPAQAVMAPTPVVLDDLHQHGIDHGVLWTRGVDLDIFTPQRANVLNTAHPIFLYVGRVAVEKNVEAFLALDRPDRCAGRQPRRRDARRPARSLPGSAAHRPRHGPSPCRAVFMARRLRAVPGPLAAVRRRQAWRRGGPTRIAKPCRNPIRNCRPTRPCRGRRQPRALTTRSSRTPTKATAAWHAPGTPPSTRCPACATRCWRKARSARS
ncbi:Glycosyltransferase Family 4 [compost metagenome]